MLKKTIAYTDYEGVEREEDFYFNLTQSELMVMELSEEGGLKKMMERIIKEKNQKRMIQVFQEMIGKSYGEKSADGRKFIKNEALTEAFTQTPAYDKLFMELATDETAAMEFIRGIMPAEMVAIADKNAEEAAPAAEQQTMAVIK